MATHRPLGDSGIRVSVSGLGGNVFGGARLDQQATDAVVGTALIDVRGVDEIDSEISGGQSEEFLGQALRARRDEMVIATKFNLAGYPDVSVHDLVRRQVEDSLRRLNTDRIDLYQLHMVDPSVNPVELMSVLKELVDEGKVRAVGVCNIAAWRLTRWRGVAAEQGWTGPVSMQNYYHLLARHAESESLPCAIDQGIGFLPYHPLAGGFLTGKYKFGVQRPAGSRGAAGSPIIDTMDTEENHRILKRLNELAHDAGRSLADLALAWVAGQPGVTSVIAGASNPEQLAANAAGCTAHLDAELRAEIDAVTGVAYSPERLPYGA